MSLTFITLWRVVRVGMQDAIILPEVFAQRLSCQIRIITTFLSERRWLLLFLWKNSVNVLPTRREFKSSTANKSRGKIVTDSSIFRCYAVHLEILVQSLKYLTWQVKNLKFVLDYQFIGLHINRSRIILEIHQTILQLLRLNQGWLKNDSWN